MKTPDTERFAIVSLKNQDLKHLAPSLASNKNDVHRINADATKFPNSRTRRISILVHEGAAVALCIARYQSRSADVDHMVALSHVRSIIPSIKTKALAASINPPLEPSISEHLRTGGHLTTIETIELAQILERDIVTMSILEELRTHLAELPQTESKLALRRAEQRDAMATALEVTGIDSRKALPPADRDEDDPRPFMAYVKSANFREASLIRHDARTLPDWLEDHRSSDGHLDCVVFADPSNERDRVTITYADKEKLEEVTGTDLIYFRTHQPGYILVQYKRMMKDASGQESYRPDGQLDAEIDRMRKLIPDREREWFNSPADYRLSSEPFFVKLVDSQLTRRDTHKLAEGMYYPLGLFERILESDSARGPRGGRLITGRSAPKHLSNDLFVQLLKGGWIGTIGTGTDDLSAVIGSLLSQKRGVVVAEDHRSPWDSWGPRSGTEWLEV